jgi:hypothetical protein
VRLPLSATVATRRRKCQSGQNLRFPLQLFLAPSLRHQLRPRNRKFQSIGAAHVLRPSFREPPRFSTRTVPQPQAVVALATIKCSSAFDEKSGPARIYHWTRMRHCGGRSSDAEPLSPRPFSPACIISMPGYDFREGQVCTGRAATMSGKVRTTTTFLL